MKTAWQRILLILTGTLVVFNEFLIYYIQSKRWPTVPSRSENDRQVLLLVADPQIQGYQDESLFPLGTLARWDVDRFLAKTFQYAFAYSEPDIVLFLGDLMDEGSKATSTEYEATLDRFHAVFGLAQFVKKIYIPGDNDIGGEGKDFVTKEKVTRFQHNFGNITDMIKFSFIDYVKLDVHINHFAEDKVQVAKSMAKKQLSPFSVMLNHETILTGSKNFVYPFTRRLKPKLIFSAHWHKTAVFTCDDCLKENEYSWNVKRNDLTHIDDYLTINLMERETMAEIAVPTCSYRMGTSDMGYGVAILEKDLTVKFTVLWLPRRYTMLLTYVISYAIFGILYLVIGRTRSRR